MENISFEGLASAMAELPRRRARFVLDSREPSSDSWGSLDGNGPSAATLTRIRVEATGCKLCVNSICICTERCRNSHGNSVPQVRIQYIEM